MHIRRTLNRLQIPGLPENHKGPKTEIVLQEPKTSNSARSIPLLPNVLQDLLRWRTVQEADRTAAGERYQESGMIVTNPLGGYIEPRTFSDYYAQILALAGLPHFTFHALRHTFASRAMEQGMDEKTLSVLLGHYSVSFTLDTYAHVLDDHKWEGMQLMDELYSIDQSAPGQQVYPLLVTPETGGYTFTAPDFPQVSIWAGTVEDGLPQIRAALKDTLLTQVYPPVATPLNEVIAQPGQFSLQIAL